MALVDAPGCGTPAMVHPWPFEPQARRTDPALVKYSLSMPRSCGCSYSGVGAYCTHPSGPLGDRLYSAVQSTPRAGLRRATMPGEPCTAGVTAQGPSRLGAFDRMRSLSPSARVRPLCAGCRQRLGHPRLQRVRCAPHVCTAQYFVAHAPELHNVFILIFFPFLVWRLAVLPPETCVAGADVAGFTKQVDE